MTAEPIAPFGEPTIISAVLGVGHDGEAEAVLQIRYSNGAVRALSLPCDAIDAAIATTRVESLDDLVGQSWAVLVPALALPS